MLLRRLICYGSVHRSVSLTVVWVAIIMSFINSDLVAQRTRSKAPPLGERLFYGGSFGLQFGTITDIDVSPVIGLWLLPRLNIAVGPKYRFFKDPFDRTDIFGGRVYSQFFFVKDLDNFIPAGIHLGFFLHIEDELLSLESSFWKGQPDNSERLLKNTGLAGVGVSQPMGIRSSLNLMILWPLNDSFNDLIYDLYGIPEVRISIIF